MSEDGGRRSEVRSQRAEGGKGQRAEDGLKIEDEKLRRLEDRTTRGQRPGDKEGEKIRR